MTDILFRADNDALRFGGLEKSANGAPIPLICLGPSAEMRTSGIVAGVLMRLYKVVSSAKVHNLMSPDKHWSVSIVYRRKSVGPRILP